ncbi:hypothetical protein [Nocardioides convexus]|uniref:hypothetical protein n=1 Tax=Nocardioides convexus TaxID=2712224 RepID=UPI002418AC16|nr:hypothetical protein [Nocardioides convexus]
MTTTPLRRAAPMLNKVPEVTVWFWIIKILCTTVGESLRRLRQRDPRLRHWSPPPCSSRWSSSSCSPCRCGCAPTSPLRTG